jgi:TetR/AcrR family transcriptional regulator, transcriptional repressor for nem operon
MAVSTANSVPKERLAAGAVSYALNTSAARMNDATTLDEYISRYLSADHRERRADGV